MTVTTVHAYSTDNPDTVAAFREAVEKMATVQQRCVADAEILGKNRGPLVQRGFGGMRVVGLAADDPQDPPAGWRYIRDRLEPRRGKPGEDGRRWLADHQPPDLRGILAGHGLPRHARSDPDAMRYSLNSPQIFEHDGTVWALYNGVIDGECTWTPRRLSEVHAAFEALESAEQSAKAVR